MAGFAPYNGDIIPLDSGTPASTGDESGGGFAPYNGEIVPLSKKDVPSGWTTAAREAAPAVLPGAAAMAGFGAGAGFVAPAVPFAAAATAPIGGLGGPALELLGGLGGAGLAAWGANKAQEAGIEALPEGAKEAIGQSEAQRRVDVAAHPVITELSRLAPQALVMRPSAELALAQRGMGAGIGAIQEGLGEYRSGEDLSASKIGEAAAAGALFNKETGLGSRLSGVGSRVAETVVPKKTSTPETEVNVPPSGTAPDQTSGAAPVPTPPSAPDPGDVVGIKFPKAPSQRATVDSYWDNGQSVRVRYDDGSSQDMLTHELLRDQTEPPPPLNELPRGTDLPGSVPTEDERFNLWDEADRSAPRPARPGTNQGNLGAEAIQAIQRADAFERQANDPNSRLSEEGRLDALMMAQRLRAQYGHIGGPVDVSPEDQAAANAARAPADTLLGNAPPIDRGPQSFTPEELANRPAPAAPDNLVDRTPRAPRGPANFTPEEIAAARQNPGSTGNILNQEVPNLPRTPVQFSPQELAAAQAARSAPAAPPAPKTSLLDMPPAPQPVAPAPPPIAARPEALPQQPAPVAAVPKPEIVGRPLGNSQAFTSTGRAVPVTYALVEANDLVTSHDDSLRENPNYPQEVQPRDRTRGVTELQMRDMLGPKFQPELLGESPDAANGAPIVGPDGVVESGNMRSMAIRRAYDQNLPAAAAYRDYLASKGYPVEGMQRPILVRINRAAMSPQDRASFANEANKPAQLEMSATERAMADAAQMPDHLLGNYRPGELTAAENRPFIKSVLTAIASPTEYGKLVAPDGSLSADGLRRVQAALLAKAYGDSATVQRLVEDTDTNVKAIGNALIEAGPSWAKMRAAAAQGEIPRELDITPNLIGAVDLITRARAEGRNVVEYVKQNDIFSGDIIPPETESVLRWMLGGAEFTKRIAQDKIADAARDYADSASKVEPGPGLFGGAPVSALELTEKARANAQDKDQKLKNQYDLLRQKVEQPGGAEAVRGGAGENGPEAQGRPDDSAGPSGTEGGPKGLAESAGPNFEREPAPTFYSALERNIEAIPQGRALAPQWKNIIDNLSQKGVKKEEVDWTGVKDWLDAQKGNVSKADLLNHVRENNVQLHEVVKGAPIEPTDIAATRERFQQLVDKAESVERQGGQLSPAEHRELDRLSAALDGVPNPWLSHNSNTKFKSYALPGGENYREMLLTMPHADPENMVPDLLAREKYRAQWAELADRINAIHNQMTAIPDGRVGDLPQKVADLRDQQDALHKKMVDESLARVQPNQHKTPYQSPHWDEPNVLAHIRFDDRVGPNGEKILHVQEVQSDWHQKGRKDGYTDPNAGEKLVRAREAMTDAYDQRSSAHDEMTTVRLAAENSRAKDIYRVTARDGRVLYDGPDWRIAREVRNENRGSQSEEIPAELTPEHRGAIRAAGERYVAAARAADEATAAYGALIQRPRGVPDAPFKSSWHELAMKRMLRFAAENGYDRLSWDTGATQADRYDLSKQIDHIIWDQKPSGNGVLIAYDQHGNPVVSEGPMAPEKVTDYIGKEAAEKLMAQPLSRSKQRVLNNADLKVGGEGMRGFYDKILPAFMNKYGKKWGAKVEDSAIPVDRTNFGHVSAREDRDGTWFLHDNDEGSEIGHGLSREEAFAQADKLNGFKSQISVHSVDITPAMRESVMQGQGLFEQKGPQFDFGPRKTPQIEKTEQGDQYVMPGAERSATQAAAARGEKIAPPVRQKPADSGLFAPKEPEQPGLFDQSKPSGINEEAARYVVDNGKATTHEHLVGVDARTGEIFHTGTDKNPKFVSFPDSLMSRAEDPSENLVLHHNHPAGTALSRGDISALSYPGVSHIVAHTHDGNISIASLSNAMRARGHSGLSVSLILKRAIAAASRHITDIGNGLIRDGVATTAELNRTFSEVVARGLHQANIIDYVTSHALPDHPWMQDLVDAATKGAAKEARNAGITQDANRYAEPVRPEEGMASLPGGRNQGSEAVATGVGGGDGRGAEGAGQTRPQVDSRGQYRLLEGQKPGLAEDDEERYRSARAGPQYGSREGQPHTAPTDPNPLDDLSHQIAQNAGMGHNGGPPMDPPGVVARQAERMLPSRNGDPPTKILSAVSSKATMPRTLASLDWRSSRYWRAWQEKDNTARALQHHWSDMSQDYAALTAAQRDKLSAVEELDRATGTTRRNDGRQIVARNESSERLEMSKPGQSIVLDPATTEAYHQRRALFRDVWDTLMQSAAKKLWPEGLEYNGTTDPAELSRMADATDSKPLKKQLNNIAELMTSMRGERNAAYTPLMRFGDYYIGIKPKPGTQGADTMNWDGNGFPPTARFELVDSRSADTLLDRMAGKTINEGSLPKSAADRIADLRARYPEADYDIESGYLQRNADALRKLNIPAIEKMFIALQQQDSKLFGPMVEEMRDKLYDELRAGFKRQASMVPGYSTDFGRATGAYINWTSNHAAELQHGDDIRAAQENYIDKHPDARVRRYWQTWTDYQNNPAEEMQRLRQFGFYWQLAANPSSTLLIATHGPMVAHATLGAGAGYAAAGRHLYGAFGEALSNVKVDSKTGLHVDMDAMGKTPEERALVKEAIGTGLVHASVAEDLRGLGQGQAELMGIDGNKWKRTLNILSSNIAVADQVNRVATLLGAYRLAKQPGMLDKIAKTWGDNQVFTEAVRRDGLTPQTVAKFMVDEGLFVWGKRNRAPLQRGFGALLFQFKNFEANYLGTLYKFMTRMGPEGKVAGTFMLAGLGALGGALSLPFTDDLVKVGDWIGKTITGIDPMIESKIYQAMENAGMSKLGAEAMLRGPARSMLGIDLSSRLGFGDVASRNMSGVDALGTVPSMMYGRLSSAWNRAQHGQTAAGIADLLPTAARNVVRAVGVLPERGLQSQYGNTVIPKGGVSTGDEVAQGLGFEPATVARAYEQRGFDVRSAQAARDLTGRLTSKVVDLESQIIDANKRGDSQGAQRLTGEMQQIYRDNPEVRISRQAVRHGIQKLTDPEAVARQQMPKMLRGQESPYVGAGPQLRASGGRIHAAAAQADPEPTDAQIQAGNYKKGHLSLHGMPVTIENAKGSLRRGVGKDGNPWEVQMPHHYGYFKKSEGADSEHVDAFIGPDHTSKRVFVIDQLDADTGKFDEHKVMIGFSSIHAALLGYRRSFSDGRGAERAGNIRSMSAKDFKKWLYEGNTKRPMAA